MRKKSDIRVPYNFKLFREFCLHYVDVCLIIISNNEKNVLTTLKRLKNLNVKSHCMAAFFFTYHWNWCTWWYIRLTHSQYLERVLTEKSWRLENDPESDLFYWYSRQISEFRWHFWGPGRFDKLLFFVWAVKDLEKLRSPRYFF